MTYHIPSDEKVRKAVKEVLKKNHSVSSQRKLKVLVEKELLTKKKIFHVGERRLRNIVLKSSLADIEIYSREGDPHKILARCPDVTAH